MLEPAELIHGEGIHLRVVTCLVRDRGPLSPQQGLLTVRPVSAYPVPRCRRALRCAPAGRGCVAGSTGVRL